MTSLDSTEICIFQTLYWQNLFRLIIVLVTSNLLMLNVPLLNYAYVRYIEWNVMEDFFYVF